MTTAMKNYEQIKLLLCANGCKSLDDWSDIKKLFSKFFTTSDFPNVEITEKGLDYATFDDWFECGLGNGDIVLDGEEVSQIGKTDLNVAIIVGTLQNDKVIVRNEERVVKHLKIADSVSQQRYKVALFHQGLRYNPQTCTLSSRYIPKPNEHVYITGEDAEAFGILRDRNVETGQVLMYCYYDYKNKILGHNMQETRFNLIDYEFEPIKGDLATDTRRSFSSCMTRLGKELEKVGKCWNDRLRRIEPIEMQLKQGEKYWYITDKFELKCEVEKLNGTSRLRSNRGNYFRNYDEAALTLQWLVDKINLRLAK